MHIAEAWINGKDVFLPYGDACSEEKEGTVEFDDGLPGSWRSIRWIEFRNDG